MLTSDSFARGSILWLTDPFKDVTSGDSDDEPPDIPETLNGIETGLLGHPVMILHKLAGTTDVAVCLLTSLRGRDVDDRQHTYQYQYNHEFYLAVHPTDPPCPFLYPQLRLEHDLPLRKSCYLSIRTRYTIPINMLEHYNRHRPELRYQLTAKSFKTVAKTFAMKFSRPSRSQLKGGSSTKLLCNVPQETVPEGIQATMTHSESDLGSKGRSPAKVEPSAMAQSQSERDSLTASTSSISANPPSTCVESIEKHDTTCLGLLFTLGGFKTRVIAGIIDFVLAMVEKSEEFLDAFRTHFYKPGA